MTGNEYQTLIKKTAIYPAPIGLAYCAMGLTGEAGEVSDKIKKLYRDNNFYETKVISDESVEAIAKELGDVMWYIAATASELGLAMDDIMQMNHDKLIKRRETGTLHGSGDDRENIL